MALDTERLRSRLLAIAKSKTDVIVNRVKDAYDKGIKGDALEEELKKAMQDEGLTAEAEIMDISMMTRIEGV